MAEETEEKPEKEEKEEEPEKKKKKMPGKRVGKVPKDILFTPGGLILVFFAIGMEILDLIIPPTAIDSLVIELIPEVIFAFFLNQIAGISFREMIVPAIIERLDFLGIIPSSLKFFI